jgi:flagellar basal-body rod protein FlgF
MEASLSVSLSSQIALERRLSTIADNVANINTTGFRSTEVKFNEQMLKSRTANVAFVTPGNEYLSSRTGGLNPTGNPLDFAIKGDAWFQIDTQAGATLTRDGRFSVTDNGNLVTTEGFPVLDVGGSPIQLDMTNGAPKIASDGVLYQNGRPVASLGLYTADVDKGFVRVGNSGVVTTDTPQPVVDRIDAGVVQGYVENSNVNAIGEMTQLIMVQRAFESVAAIVKQSEGTLEDAIKTLGEK